MFEHTKDPDWLKLQEAVWQEHLEYRFKQEGYTKKQTQVVKAFYLSGDIEQFIAGVKRRKNITRSGKDIKLVFLILGMPVNYK